MNAFIVPPPYRHLCCAYCGRPHQTGKTVHTTRGLAYCDLACDKAHISGQVPKALAPQVTPAAPEPPWPDDLDLLT